MKCGHCKTPDVDMAHVRTCSVAMATPPVAKPGPATEGMYRKDGQIYKVTRAIYGSGQLYARMVTVATDYDGHPVVAMRMAKGVVAKLTQADRMTVAEAAAFGHLYGICIRCAATLTDEESIKRGLGPVCATKI